MHYVELLMMPNSLCSQVTCSWDYSICLNPQIRLWTEISHHRRHHHHHLLLSPLETQGVNKTSPSDPISGQLLNFTQLFHSSSASLWTDLLHVCLGLPLLCFPCGFQSKASLSMASFPFLNVCPIQFHSRLLICVDISVSSFLLQSSSFEITSGQWIFKIFHKQRFMKVCNFEVVVLPTFHVSDLYRMSQEERTKLRESVPYVNH